LPTTSNIPQGSVRKKFLSILFMKFAENLNRDVNLFPGATITILNKPLKGRVQTMTCYFRHLNEILTKAGITVTKENRQELDQIIHSIVKVNYKNCPQTWKEIKKRRAEDQDQFIAQLKTAWNQKHKTKT